MVIGQNGKAEDIELNVCKTKHLTNTRSSSADEALRLTPPKVLSLEQALDFYRHRRTPGGNTEISAYPQKDPGFQDAQKKRYEKLDVQGCSAFMKFRFIKAEQPFSLSAPLFFSLSLKKIFVLLIHSIH